MVRPSAPRSRPRRPGRRRCGPGQLVAVIVLIAVAEGLRGHLTRWMSEVTAGMYVGNPAAEYATDSGNSSPTLWETAKPS
jgi:CRISPR-associated protein (Cas_Cas2CT1978)